MDNERSQHQLVTDLSVAEWDRLFPSGTRTPTQMKMRLRHVIMAGLDNLHRFPGENPVAEGGPFDFSDLMSPPLTVGFDIAMRLYLKVGGDNRAELEEAAREAAESFFGHESFRLAEWEVEPVQVPSYGEKMAEMLGMAPFKKFKATVTVLEESGED